MKQRVKEMEAEAAKLREMQAQAEKDMNMGEEGTHTFFLSLPYAMNQARVLSAPMLQIDLTLYPCLIFIIFRQGGCGL